MHTKLLEAAKLKVRSHGCCMPSFLLGFLCRCFEHFADWRCMPGGGMRPDHVVSIALMATCFSTQTRDV
jgi:hypothetical protein